MSSAPALWCVGPERVEQRPGALGEGVLVEMLYSGISRGTERLVFEAAFPASEAQRMRGPAQEGEFPFPVKYGYCAVGRVVEGELTGKTVLALHPHQTRFRLPQESLTLLPDDLPPARAVLGPNLETALNVLWDGGATAGDRIAVVGAGAVRCADRVARRSPAGHRRHARRRESGPRRDGFGARLCVRTAGGRAPRLRCRLPCVRQR